MRTRLTLLPGQPGTKELSARYGEQLVCVRYRYDAQKRQRYKTVELIVEESGMMAWPAVMRPHESPTARPGQFRIVDLRIRIYEENSASLRLCVKSGFLLWEAALRQQVKQAGGTWNAQRKVWELAYEQVVQLGLRDRLVREEAI